MLTHTPISRIVSLILSFCLSIMLLSTATFAEVLPTETLTIGESGEESISNYATLGFSSSVDFASILTKNTDDIDLTNISGPIELNYSFVNTIPLSDGWIITADKTNKIVIFNVVTNQVGASFQLNATPHDMALDHETGILMVTMKASSSLAKIDILGGTVSYIQLPNEGSTIENADAGRVFVRLITGGAWWDVGICVVDYTTDSIIYQNTPRFEADGSLYAFNEKYNYLFIGNTGTSPSTLWKYSYNPQTGELTLLEESAHGSFGSNGQDLRVSPNGEHLIFCNGGGNGNGYTVFNINPHDFNQRFGEFDTGAYPGSGWFSLDSKYFLGTNYDSIKMFDVDTHVLLATIYLNTASHGERVYFSRGNKLIYWFNGSVGRVYKTYIDDGTPVDVDSIEVSGYDIGFDRNISSYTVILTDETKNAPEIYVDANEMFDVKITYPASIPGTATITVGASGVTKKTYSISFRVGTNDIIDFPDPNFKRALIDAGVDKDGDGEISKDEAEQITFLRVRNNISSLAGIEYFTSLVALDCSDNRLTALDLQNNTLLEELYCSFNQLTNLDLSSNASLAFLGCSDNSLITLNVSNNPLLVGVECNKNQLTSLDISNNPYLYWLDCSNNQIAFLNVSNKPYLYWLDCGYNQLTSLDVSNNPYLEVFNCSGNRLASLDVSSNPHLYWLDCSENLLTSLDVSNNPALWVLHCSDNLLKSLVVSNKSNLVEFSCSNNQLTSLNISNNPALVSLICSNNRLSTLNASNTPALRVLSCEHNYMSSHSAIIGLNTAQLSYFEFDPQYASGGGGDGGGGGGDSGGGGGRTSSVTTTGTPSNAPVSVTHTAANTATQNAIVAAKAADSNNATARIRNPGEISLSTLQSMANIARQAGMTLQLQADSMSANNMEVDVRITLNPALAAGDLNMSASTTNPQAISTTNHFAKHFSNDLMTVSLGQQGSFGQSVTIAAKIAAGLSPDNLMFYAYNRASNTYILISNSKYRIDQNGYVHFNTTLAGDIIISNGPLVKK